MKFFDPSQQFKHRFTHDFETKSDKDITTHGMYRSQAAKGFKIVMMSYALDDEPVRLVECYDKQLPKWYLNDVLRDPTILKCSYNAPYEIGSVEAEYGIHVDITQWQCTKVMAMMAGYASNLAETAKSMRLDVLKQARGKQLIKLFSNPAEEKHMKKNGNNFWNLPEYFPEQWEEFCEYCIQDTVVERAILTHPTVADMPLITEAERRYWFMDQRINKRGVKIDKELVDMVLDMYNEHTYKLIKEGTMLTGLQNFNSRDQVLAWLNSNDCIMKSLARDNVMEKLGHPGLATNLKRVLELRLETSKSSMGKFILMQNMCSHRGRIYGWAQHYGANRTGRVSSPGLNLVNMVKNKLKYEPLEHLRELIRHRCPKAINHFYGPLSKVFSEATRSMFIPEEGYKFGVSDFASIESRVAAWFAGAEWKLQAFREGKDIYLVNAEAMYKVPYEELANYKGGKHPLREPAKVGELLCGFRGGERAMIRGKALKSGLLKEKDLPKIKNGWRKANPEIVKGWTELENAAKEALADPGLIVPCFGGKVKYMMHHDNLLCKLPSGRCLSYVRAVRKKVVRINKEYAPWRVLEWCAQEMPDVLIPDAFRTAFKYDKGKALERTVKDWCIYVEKYFGQEFPWYVIDGYCSKKKEYDSIVYEGMVDTGTGRKWGTTDTHGGKLFENIVQAASRDILYNAMENLEAEKIDIVIHVYDETVNEIPLWDSVKRINEVMERPVWWAPDLPLKAEGFETDFYMKED
jgi:DNA polymerase